jgi:hypothetical protein
MAAKVVVRAAAKAGKVATSVAAERRAASGVRAGGGKAKAKAAGNVEPGGAVVAGQAVNAVAGAAEGSGKAGAEDLAVRDAARVEVGSDAVREAFAVRPPGTGRTGRQAVVSRSSGVKPRARAPAIAPRLAAVVGQAGRAGLSASRVRVVGHGLGAAAPEMRSPAKRTLGAVRSPNPAAFDARMTWTTTPPGIGGAVPRRN